jgi:hypothetical protein
VRVISDFGVVEICDEERARRVYGSASNAELKFSHRGRLVAIWLRSAGDDTGQLGEPHGRSTCTTRRVCNDAGAFIGHDKNLEHKTLPQQPIAGKIATRRG